MNNDTNRASRDRSATLAAVGAVGMAAVLLTLTGCSALTPYQKVQQQHFATYADAPTKGDLAWVMPKWVPSDAKDIDVRLDTEDPGYDIRFTSARGVDPTACTPLDDTHGGPAIPAEFLPETLPTDGLMTCGDGRATVRVGDAWYGWTTKTAIESGSGTDDTLRPSGSPSAG
ncbi:hypothetical protein [Curtobacterium sp. RRHDQ10]|uniref:hypothetical protein n=1 Tax=Curtobacterium phyllosphaerae TaxID=3413379 RepID=UPI003BF2D20C